MRHTRAHTGNRRSHHALKAQAIITDKETGVPHLRHRVSLEDGRYRGKKVLNVVGKVEKKQVSKAPAKSTAKKAVKKVAKKAVKKAAKKKAD